MAVRQAQPAGDPLGLARFTVTPGFNQADQVGLDLGERVLQGNLPGLPPRPVASPDIPRDHPDRRLRDRAIRGIGIEGHTASIAANTATSPTLPRQASRLCWVVRR